MSNRYWVGGIGIWDDSDTTHWSTSSGGAGGASVPTSSDDVFLNSNSGLSGGTITLNTIRAYCHNFTSTTGSVYSILDGNNGYTIEIDGSFQIESGTTIGGHIFLDFESTGNETITTGGGVIRNIQFYNTGTFTLQDNLFMTGGFECGRGTFNANGYNVTADDFYFYADIGANPTINMGSGIWTVTGSGSVWYIDNYDGQSVNFITGNSVINFTDTTLNEKDFSYYTDGALNTSIHTGLHIIFSGQGTFKVNTKDYFQNGKHSSSFSKQSKHSSTFTNQSKS